MIAREPFKRNTENKVEISGRELLQSLAAAVTELCNLVEHWLNRQDELSERIARLERRRR